jgi:hypothetical protein
VGSPIKPQSTWTVRSKYTVWQCATCQRPSASQMRGVPLVEFERCGEPSDQPANLIQRAKTCQIMPDYWAILEIIRRYQELPQPIQPIQPYYCWLKINQNIFKWPLSAQLSSSTKLRTIDVSNGLLLLFFFSYIWHQQLKCFHMLADHIHV